MCYTFILDKLSKPTSNTILYHKCARDILSNNLCHYSCAYEASLFHAKAVCVLEPGNVQNWETYLDIGANRTKILTKQEIKEICNTILTLNPENIKGVTYLKNIDLSLIHISEPTRPY